MYVCHGSDLYLGNQAQVGFIKLEDPFEYKTQSHSRYRAPQPLSSTSNSKYLKENDYVELHNIASMMVVKLSSCKGMDVCGGGGGG